MPRARKAKKYKVNALVTGATEPCSSDPHLSAPLSPAGNPQFLPQPSLHPLQRHAQSHRVNSGVFTVTAGKFRGGGLRVSPHRACRACLWCQNKVLGTHLRTVWPQSMFGAAPRAEVEMGRHWLAGEIAPGQSQESSWWPAQQAKSLYYSLSQTLRRLKRLPWTTLME